MHSVAVLKLYLFTNGLIASDSGDYVNIYISRSKSCYQLKTMNTSLSRKLKRKKSLPNIKIGQHFDEGEIIENIPVRIQTI